MPKNRSAFGLYAPLHVTILPGEAAPCAPAPRNQALFITAM